MSTIHNDQALTVQQRQEQANLILCKVDYICRELNRENSKVLVWFYQHAQAVQKFIKTTVPEAEDTHVEIMGSRRWGLTHWLSDIDAAAVTNYENQQKIIDALSTFYRDKYPKIEQFSMKTKAGLYLFILKQFADPELGEMKLEYTVQTPEVNTAIIDGMEKKIKKQFVDDRQRVGYALAMMDAVYKNDMEQQLRLKEWTRILPNKL